jgi:hypothetical protein
MQLYGDGPAYPDARGKYPPIDNSGFIACYRTSGAPILIDAVRQDVQTWKSEDH